MLVFVTPLSRAASAAFRFSGRLKLPLGPPSPGGDGGVPVTYPEMEAVLALRCAASWRGSTRRDEAGQGVGCCGSLRDPRSCRGAEHAARRPGLLPCRVPAAPVGTGEPGGAGRGGLQPASTELHLVRDAGLIQSTCKCLSSFIFPAQNNLLSKVSSNKGGC